LATTTTKSKKPVRSSSTPAKGKPAARAATKAAKPAAKAAAKSAAKSSKPVAKPARGAKPASRTPVASKRAAVPKAAATKKPVAKKPAAPKKPKAIALPTDPVERLRHETKRALEELKALNITELDVRGKTSIADYIVVASGTSTRHVKAIADEVVKYAKRAGSMPLGVEGQREAEWVLIDLGDIVCHVMLPRVREFYGLERLWSVGAEQIEALRA
jgi:ribosome silencing factor RsfS/YbeB/iojap